MLPRTFSRSASRGLALLVVLLATTGLSSAAAPNHPGVAPAAKPPKLLDSGTISTSVGNVTSALSDTVTWGADTGPGIRDYAIHLQATTSLGGQTAELETDPVAGWTGGDQFPWGPDHLAPLALWSWWVWSGGVNDSANWSLDPDGVHLDRLVPWASATFHLYGVSAPRVAVSIDPSILVSGEATGTGFVLAQSGTPNGFPSDAGYPNLTASVHPALVRLFAFVQSWNTTTGRPGFDFTSLDSGFGLARQIGASVLLSVTGGSFGDGNGLPTGVPLNRSVVVNASTTSGYFPTPSAYYAIVQGISNHTHAQNESVAYWSLGNEITLSSATVVDAYASILNAGIDALRLHEPEARVGTDDMLASQYLDRFAAEVPRTGFLSLHYYSSKGICQTSNGSYCPPSGGGNGTPTSALFLHAAFSGNPARMPPAVAVRAWHNDTGRWLPVVVSETNLGYVGGIGSPTEAVGTDPRDQSLVGAAWLGSLLVDSSQQNVSAITIYTFTSGANAPSTLTYAYGGFGFGVTSESSSGATTRYAPYWAMRLWGSTIPAGAPGISVADSDPASVPAYAVADGGKVDVAFVNRVAENVTVALNVSGNYTLNATSVLDGTTYDEAYDAASNTTTVLRSGIRTVTAPAHDLVVLHGYGIGVAEFVPTVSTGNGSGSGGSGNGSGAGGSGSGGTGGTGSSGNSSGNQSGAGTGHASGNGSSNQSTPTQNQTGSPTNGSGGIPNGTNGSGGPAGSAPPPEGPRSPPATTPLPPGAGLAPTARSTADRLVGIGSAVVFVVAGIAAYAAYRAARRSQRAGTA